jgi:tRNA U34 5-carboxymethylaminomethyl modifying GTPase MnmE/TrmE
VAITPIAGTTHKGVPIDSDSTACPVHVVDTPLREALDEVEKIGVARAWSKSNH